MHATNTQQTRHSLPFLTVRFAGRHNDANQTAHRPRIARKRMKQGTRRHGDTGERQDSMRLTVRFADQRQSVRNCHTLFPTNWKVNDSKPTLRACESGENSPTRRVERVRNLFKLVG